jgi:hypothetical protein
MTVLARTLYRLRTPLDLETALGEVVRTDHVLQSTAQLHDGRLETLLFPADARGRRLSDVELMVLDPRRLDPAAEPVD